ncbi:hypothetical protein [Sphingobacterium arenae]|uniref:Uncharacterized protein n=1 Tax=Sphingobacterium arenae TaxID=1280598 RepID=A0ABR7Y2X3_9SPHI|nr:hypothetical protein [Sphingobacterium arenae]MBD1425646.1 hypothetical protein [Sphingobacterium arenae]
MMGRRFVSSQQKRRSPDKAMKMKANFVASMGTCIVISGKTAASLSGILTKSYAVKTSAHGKTKGKHDLTHTSPYASTTRKVSIILTFPFAFAFLESASQIVFGIEMAPSHLTWHQDATFYPTGIGTIFNVQLTHHLLSGEQGIYFAWLESRRACLRYIHSNIKCFQDGQYDGTLYAFTWPTATGIIVHCKMVL